MLKWGTWQETGNYKENQKEIPGLKNILMGSRNSINDLTAI